MEDKNIPYSAYEFSLALSERHTKRIWIALIICIILLFGSNALWLYEWCQYDYSYTETYEQDGEGINVIGNLNEVEQWAKKSQNLMAEEEKTESQEAQDNGNDSWFIPYWNWIPHRWMDHR